MRLWVIGAVCLFMCGIAGCQPDPNSVEDQIEILKSKKSTKEKMKACKNLRRIASQKAVPGLLEALKTSNNKVRGEIAVILGELKNPVAAPALAQALDYAVPDDNSRLSVEANEANKHIARALGDIGASVAAKPLIQLVKSTKDNFVRMEAVASMGKLKDRSAVSILSEIAVNPENPAILSRKALLSLGLLKDPKAVSVFFKTLFVERDDVSLFPESAFGIFASGDQAKERALLLLKGEDRKSMAWTKERKIPEEEVLARAAQLQIDLRDPKAIPLLVRLLRYKNPAVRMHAARALGRMRAVEAIGPLKQMLSPENDAILGVIVKSLVLIGDTKVIPDLKKCSEIGPWNQREYCIIGLALLGKQKEIAVLDLLLRKESSRFDQECKEIASEEECAKAKPENMTLRKKNITMYKEVIESFVACRDTTCLKKLLNSEQPMIRERAAYELGYLGAPQSVAPLVEAIRRPPSNAIDLNSRSAALCALEWIVSSNVEAKAKAKKFVPALEIQVEKDKEQILTQPSAEELMRLVVRLR